MQTNTANKALRQLEMAFGKSRDKDKFPYLQDILEAQSWHEAIFMKSIGRMVMSEPDQKGLPNPALFKKYYEMILAEAEQDRMEELNQMDAATRMWYDLRRRGWALPTLTLREGGRDPQDYADVYERMAENE